MKGFFKLFAVASLSAVAFGHTANAQETSAVKVDVPFDFIAENASLPAGSYIISVVLPENLVRIQGTDGRNSATVRFIPGFTLNSRTNAKAVFQRFGDEYFLTQVWGRGTTHTELFAGKRAQELAKEFTQDTQSQTATVVTAR